MPRFVAHAQIQSDATLRSPVAGVIVARNFDAGTLVGPGGDPIMAVADLRTLKLEAGVSELEVGRLKIGAPARVTIQAQPGQVFEGRVTALAPEVDAKNRHFRVEIKVTNKGGAMLSGMYATARVPTATAEGPIVPREAVFDRDGGRAVYRVQGDIVSMVTVTEGLTDGKRVVLTSGVQRGDTDRVRRQARGRRRQPRARRPRSLNSISRRQQLVKRAYCHVDLRYLHQASCLCNDVHPQLRGAGDRVDDAARD